MRLRTTLLHVAVLLTAGCGGSTTNGGGNGQPDGSAGHDAATGDAPYATDAGKDAPPGNDAEPQEAACGGCNCGPQPNVPQGDATPQQACALAASFQGNNGGFSEPCELFCGALNDSGAAGYYCTLPNDYVTAYQSAVGDAGQAGADAGADAGLQCPAWSGSVVVQCGIQCLGRRTDGIAAPSGRDGAALGEVFAARAYLEAVSVHAFARLERELKAHGATASLLRDVRRARRDEVRHAAMTARIARRFGGSPRAPEAEVGRSAVRSLVEIAIENAVEGCVRETYGAVVGLVEASRTRDPAVKRALESIAADECRHAELAWAVAKWVAPRLTAEERERVEQAKRDAVAAMRTEGDARTVALLEQQVWANAA